MKLRWDNQHVRWGVTSFLVIAASMLFYYGVFHMKTLITGIQTFLGILTPIVYGVVIAFLLTPVLNFLEKKIIYPLLARKEVSVGKKGRKAIRWACVILCMFLFLALIYALIMMILPELIRSIMGLIYSFPAYVKVIQKWLQSFIEKWNLNSDALDTLNQSITTAQDYLTTNILPQMQEMLKNISAGVFELINFLKNFLIGAIVSLYLMADKEGFIAKAKMLTYAIFNTQHANFIIHSMRFTNRTFIGFFSGKILDSAIIGVLCYIGMNFLNMPYILLISVIIGVTNVIPFFGPYLGAIPSIFLILLVDPLQAIYFAIFILILQQFDGNILGPKILGDSTGLSSFLVIVAILIGGGIFGIPGMIIGVPVFAVLYAALGRLVHISLIYKQVPDEEQKYTNIDCLDPETHEPVLFPAEEPKKRETPRRTAMLKFTLTLLKTIQKILTTIWILIKKYSVIIYQKVRQLKSTDRNKTVKRTEINMRLLIQRVNHASVKVDGEVIGNIGKGFLVLVGIGQNDTREIADKYMKKMLGLRIFEDENGKTNLSLADVNGELLMVSQFTLYANCKKGNRPSFIEAGAPEQANELYEYMLKEAAKVVPVVQHGIFGADMKISLENDGPFTVMLDESIM